MAFRDSAHNSAASTSVAIASSSLDIEDDDILLAFAAYWRDGVEWGDFNFPSGFTVLETASLLSGGTCKIGWKRADTESGDYTFSNDYADEIYAQIASISGRLASGDPVDVKSNTLYQTSNTTVRAAGVTITTTGSDLIYCGLCSPDGTPELAAPSGMTSRDSYDIAALGVSMELASLDNQSAGATGDKDGTAAAATRWKHAFLVALKPAAAPSGNPHYAYAQQ